MGDFTDGLKSGSLGEGAQNAVNRLSDNLSATVQDYGPEAERIIRSIANFPSFEYHYTFNDCWRAKINALYKVILYEKSEVAPEIDW